MPENPGGTWPFRTGTMMPEVSMLWDCEQNKIVNVQGKEVPDLTSNWEQQFFDMLEIDSWFDLSTPQASLFQIETSDPLGWPWDWWGTRDAQPPCDVAQYRYLGTYGEFEADAWARENTHSMWHEMYYRFEHENLPWTYRWTVWPTRAGRWADALWSGNTVAYGPVGCGYYGETPPYTGYNDGFNHQVYPMFANPFYCNKEYHQLEHQHQASGTYHPLIPGYLAADAYGNGGAGNQAWTAAGVQSGVVAAALIASPIVIL